MTAEWPRRGAGAVSPAGCCGVSCLHMAFKLPPLSSDHSSATSQASFSSTLSCRGRQAGRPEFAPSFHTRS